MRGRERYRKGEQETLQLTTNKVALFLYHEVFEKCVMPAELTYIKVRTFPAQVGV